MCRYAVNSRSSFEEVAVFRDQIVRIKDDANFGALVLASSKCDLEGE